MPDSSGNLFLDSLSEASRREVLASATTLELPLHFVLHEQDKHPPFAYFITSGLASIVVELSEGGTAEVALVGYEGLANTSSLIGPSAPPTRCFMQIEGSGIRVKFSDLLALFRSSQEIRDRIFEFIQLQLLTTSQIVACNRLHDIEARLARWLLMVRDRVGKDEVRLTHEFLGQMLGVHRPTLSVALGTLERAGLIKNGRGRVTIPQPDALQKAACDCYPITKRLINNLYKQAW